jgi:hypothetical protein
MDTNNLYVTKKEFYKVAMNLCVLIGFGVLLADTEGFGKIYIVLWALGMQLYCMYKLHLAKTADKRSDSKSTISNI